MHAEVTPVQPAEPFTVFNAVALKGMLLKQLDAHAGGLVLDLSAVQEIDTAGVQLLLMLKREAAARGRSVSFRAFSPPVRDMLGLLGLSAELSADTVTKTRGASG